MERATELDPYSLSTLVIHSAMLEHGGRHAEAVAMNDRALAVGPEFLPAHGVRAGSLLRVGRLEEALVAARKFVVDVTRGPRWWMDGNVLHVLVQAGQREAAENHEKLLRGRYPDSSYIRAYAAAALGRIDEAFDRFELMPMPPSARLSLFYSENWAEMRRSPRFEKLMKKNGWAEHYQTARATLERMKATAGRK
jgi:tetratricopeptide (TPR) repeat protein